MSATEPELPPAGWYADPAQESKDRYWDGEAWDGRPAGGGAWPPPVHVPTVPVTTPDGQVVAGWGRRAAAYVVDSVALTLVTAVLAWPAGIDVFGGLVRRGGADGGVGVWALNPTALAAWSAFLLVAVSYHVGFLVWRQATPGKLLLGLRVRRRDVPGPLAARTALVRYLAQLGPRAVVFHPVLLALGAVWLLVDHLWPLWDRDNQALHDKVADTVVVLRER